MEAQSGSYARDVPHAIAQVTAGQQALWDALVSCLVEAEAINPAELVERIAITHKGIPADISGPLSRAIGHTAVLSLLGANSHSKPTAKVRKILSELEPMQE